MISFLNTGFLKLVLLGQIKFKPYFLAILLFFNDEYPLSAKIVTRLLDLIMDRFNVGSNNLLSCVDAPLKQCEIGTPFLSTTRDSLVAFLPLSVGFLLT